MKEPTKVTSQMLLCIENSWLEDSDIFIFCEDNDMIFWDEYLELVQSETLTIYKQFGPPKTIVNNKKWLFPSSVAKKLMRN